MPASAKLPRTTDAGASAVYFPACINRIFGSSKRARRKLSLPEALVRVSARAGMRFTFRPDVVGTCCATVWHSKGYNAGNVLMANRVTENLWRWSREGSLPIVCDASSCTLGITHEVLDYLSPENRMRHRQLKSMTLSHGQPTSCHRTLPSSRRLVLQPPIQPVRCIPSESTPT